MPPLQRRVTSHQGKSIELPDGLQHEIKRLEGLFSVTSAQLRQITEHFVSELTKGLSTAGGSIPMNPTWCVGWPTGHEEGAFLALDLGGTNLRVCEIILTKKKGDFKIIQSKYKLPKELRTGTAQNLWDFLANCVQEFLDSHRESCEQLNRLPLGFTFSFPTKQEYIDHGNLQTWTKGFDVVGVEGQDVVEQFEAALKRKRLPIKVTALINDTTGALIASAYTDPRIKIGCIFGTGCNAAYMENCGSIPKLSHLNLDPEIEMAIDCEWGAYDNEHKVLPRTPYDIRIDDTSPRPGEQAFEKMISGFYIGEIFRMTLVDLYDREYIFLGQNMNKLIIPYSIDASYLSAIEEDPYANLHDTSDMFTKEFGITANAYELELCRRLAQLIGTRAARLSACGIAAICKKKGWNTCRVGADGSVFTKYPHFRDRCAAALREIFEWESEDDLIQVDSAEDGSGVGAALIAALTMKRVASGIHFGVKNLSGIFETIKAAA